MPPGRAFFTPFPSHSAITAVHEVLAPCPQETNLRELSGKPCTLQAVSAATRAGGWALTAHGRGKAAPTTLGGAGPLGPIGDTKWRRDGNPLSRGRLWELAAFPAPGQGSPELRQLPGSPASPPPNKASASAPETTRRTHAPPRARPQLPPPDQIPGRRPAAEVTWPASANRSAAAGRAQPRPAAVGLSDPGGCAERR